MSTTTSATTTAPARTTGTGALIGTGLAATALASAATTAVALAGTAAGISVDIDGAPIPILGFPQLTAIFSLVGLALAVVLAYKARRPRRTFVRTTVALTTLSLVPDVIAAATPDTKALLMLTHLVAAAIVIPAIARRLAGSTGAA